MSWMIRSLPLALFAVSITVGCGDDPQSGNLSVSYTLGFANSCTAFAVPIDTVRVTVGNQIASASAPCDPSEPIELSGVKAGTHDLLVEAIDAENYVVMDNIAAPQEDDRVEVHGGSSTNVDADLAATPAKLRFRWALLNAADNFPLMCGQSNAAIFQVNAYENGGTGLLFGPHEFECQPDPDLTDSDGFSPVPDPDRQINGSDLDAVSVEIQNMAGTMIDTVPFMFDPPGPGRTLDFTLTCVGASGGDPDCDGTVNVPEGTGEGTATDGGVDTGSGTG